MKIFELLRNPFVKVIGIGLVLYFALFNDKNNPDALGNRLAPQRIKSELLDAGEKGNFIISNVRLAQQIAEDNARKKSVAAALNNEVSVFDIEAGSGEDKSACGDVVEISYGIYDNEGKQLGFKEKEKLIIGNNEKEIFEKNIIGMAQDGVRDIKVPYNFSGSDKELTKLLQFYRSDLRYQITLLSFLHNPDSQLVCKK